jgi:hypothetical protein
VIHITLLFHGQALSHVAGSSTPQLFATTLSAKILGSLFGTLTCVRLSPLSRMHSRLVLIYAGCGDLAAATSVAAPPCSPFPFHLLRCVSDSSFGYLLWSASSDSFRLRLACVVDISSCPSGWTDVMLLPFTKMELPRPPRARVRPNPKVHGTSRQSNPIKPAAQIAGGQLQQQ